MNDKPKIGTLEYAMQAAEACRKYVGTNRGPMFGDSLVLLADEVVLLKNRLCVELCGEDGPEPGDDHSRQCPWSGVRPRCLWDTDGDGKCHRHPQGCPRTEPVRLGPTPTAGRTCQACENGDHPRCTSAEKCVCPCANDQDFRLYRYRKETT